MKYYIHKQTNEPLALLQGTMVDVYTASGEREACINLCIFPNRKCANGVPFQAISFIELKNFKRINKNLFNQICPDFGQFRHKNDKTIEYLEMETIPVRKERFGI